MTTVQQRIALDEPVDLLVRPVAAGEEPEPDDDLGDDAAAE